MSLSLCFNFGCLYVHHAHVILPENFENNFSIRYHSSKLAVLLLSKRSANGENFPMTRLTFTDC